MSAPANLCRSKPPPRHAGRWGVDAIPALGSRMKALALISLLTFWLPRSGSAQELLADSVHFGTNVWRAAEGLLPDRMHAADVRGFYPLYRTLWKRNEGDLLVCLRYPGMEFSGRPYDIAVLSTNMGIVRHGEVTASDGDTPYCLAEVMTDDTKLPDRLRRRWLLAVGFWNRHFQEACRLQSQGGSTNSPDRVKAVLETLPLEFYFRLVRWSDVPPHDANLMPDSELRVRWVESGTNVLLDAKQLRATPSRFQLPRETFKRMGASLEPASAPIAPLPQR